MRTFLISTLVPAAAILLALGQARAADNALTGEMTVFNYLVGSWSCATKLPAMGARSAHTEQTTVTFDAVPGNVLHDHVASAEYAGDDYFGYNAKMKLYWSASADNVGAHGSATSSDGKTYSGTSAIGPMTMSVTSTYAQVSPTNIAFHEVISGGGEQATIDSSCSR